MPFGPPWCLARPPSNDREVFRILPSLEVELRCPHCGGECRGTEITWQGIHVAARVRCRPCVREFLADLPCNQATLTPLMLDTADGNVWECAWQTTTAHGRSVRPAIDDFFSESLRGIASGGDPASVPLRVERLRPLRKAVVLNTVDFVYGHSMPFLLDAARFRTLPKDTGLIVIIQPFLRWMVPSWVHEVWIVDLPLQKALAFFPDVSRQINTELTRFEEVHLSHAFTLPLRPVDPEPFVGVRRHQFSGDRNVVTFIWREDPRRFWCGRNLLSRSVQRVFGTRPLVHWQVRKTVRLFELIRSINQDVTFRVAGLGRRGSFPPWVADHRVTAFNEDNERELCRLYASSRLVIGVLGSHMLLPSMLAGMVISLMPTGWWTAFGQDLMPNDGSEAMALFSRRVLPVETPLRPIAACAIHMLEFRDGYSRRMIDPFSAASAARTETV